jgi:hypothetical protein
MTGASAASTASRSASATSAFSFGGVSLVMR